MRRARLEEELHGQGFVFESGVDDFAKGCGSLGLAVETDVGKVKAVVSAQLIAARSLQGRLVEISRLAELASVIGVDGVRQECAGEHTISIGLVDRVTRLVPWHDRM